jgi:ferredoxin
MEAAGSSLARCDARVAVPMGRPLAEGLTDPDTVARCVEACPTGALAFRDDTRAAKPR